MPQKITSSQLNVSGIDWTPTLTGFSANPTSSVYRYVRVGKMVTLFITQGANGTSNSTGFTISLPFTAATIANMVWHELIAQHVNNGVVGTLGVATINSGGTVLNIYRDATGAAWTNTGGKRIQSLTFTYEAA